MSTNTLKWTTRPPLDRDDPELRELLAYLGQEGHSREHVLYIPNPADDADTDDFVLRCSVTGARREILVVHSLQAQDRPYHASDLLLAALRAHAAAPHLRALRCVGFYKIGNAGALWAIDRAFAARGVDLRSSPQSEGPAHVDLVRGQEGWREVHGANQLIVWVKKLLRNDKEAFGGLVVGKVVVFAHGREGNGERLFSMLLLLEPSAV